MSESAKQPKHNPRAFIAAAESYGKAAHAVAGLKDMPHALPIGTLACHCMELALKAVLLKQGATDEDLQYRYGHKLDVLLKASGLDWSGLDPEAVAICTEAMRDHRFRYIDLANYPDVRGGAVVLDLANQVFHACLQAVLPGAKRTLVPTTTARLSTAPAPQFSE